ncbi:hypothetical protein CAAN1_13S00518 [[Candida] anglica]|uniref:Alcohol acetyltransferase n=1 Tax=[Candida] anglica TaxID=148631 RepID=A0ABP0EFY0_9ASCO
MNIPSRAPGFHERQYICRNTCKYWTNLNIVAKYSQRLNRQILIQALQALLQKDPWLVLGIFRSSDSVASDRDYNGFNYKVRPVKEIHFDDVVSFEKGKVDGSTFEQLNERTIPMNVELPLWRIVVMEDEHANQWVCVYFDHAFFDGIAAVEFHKSLLVELGKLDISSEHTSEPSSCIYSFEKTPVDVPLPREEGPDKLFHLSWINRLQLWMNQKLWLPIYNYFSKPGPTFSYKPTSMNLKNKYHCVTIPSDITTKLLQYCRTHGFTLTPLLNVLALKSLESKVFPHLGQSGCNTTSCIAVNGRPFINGGKFGVFIGYDMFNLNPVRDILSATKLIYSQLTKSIKSGSCFRRVGLYAHTNIWDLYKSKLGKSDGKATVTVSNLGRYCNPIHENPSVKWRISDLWFGSNLGLVVHFLLNSISTESGDLKLIFAVLPEYDEYMEEAIDEFKRLIDEIVDN